VDQRRVQARFQLANADATRFVSSPVRLVGFEVVPPPSKRSSE
jgi:hypothetical protein